jgi:hypothetical protein
MPLSRSLRTRLPAITVVAGSISFALYDGDRPAIIGQSSYTTRVASNSQVDSATFSWNTAICTIDETTNEVTFIQAGLCTLHAVGANGGIATDLDIPIGARIIPSAPSSAVIGDTYTVAADSPGASFEIAASSDDGACAITGTKVTFLGAGVCVVVAKVGSVTSSERGIIVSAGTIAFLPSPYTASSPASLSTTKPSAYAVAVVGSSTLQGAIYSSNTTEICTISSQTNVVTFLAAGNCVITAVGANGGTASQTIPIGVVITAPTATTRNVGEST